MVVRHLQVVLGSHLLAVTDPRTDNVTREDFFQFCLAGRPQVLKQLRAGLQAGSADDSPRYVLCFVVFSLPPSVFLANAALLMPRKICRQLSVATNSNPQSET